MEMERSKTEFCLMATSDAPTGGAKIEITKCVLHVRKVQVNESIQKAHNEHLLSGHSVKYPLTKAYVRKHTITPGLTQAQVRLDQNSQKPNLMIIGLSAHAGNNGTYSRNPFRFDHFSLSHLELQFDGLPVGKRFKPDFTTGKFARPYLHLLRSLRKDLTCEGSGLSMSEYGDGVALYAFDLSGDLSGEGLHLITNVSATLDIGFSTATTEPLYVTVYMEKDGMMEVDSEYNVSLSSSSIF
jgi:hypothetical protein